MHHMWNDMKTAVNRRSFVKNGIAAAGIATAGVGLLANEPLLLAEEGPEERRGRLTRGDAALLRFAAAAEILETDFWVQYNELCGIPDSEVPGGTGNPAFTAALSVLDADMAQYVHDNTDDEFTHQNFLNAYLTSKGADPVDLVPFRTLPGSTATGSSGKPAASPARFISPAAIHCTSPAAVPTQITPVASVATAVMLLSASPFAVV